MQELFYSGFSLPSPNFSPGRIENAITSEVVYLRNTCTLSKIRNELLIRQ